MHAAKYIEQATERANATGLRGTFVFEAMRAVPKRAPKREDAKPKTFHQWGPSLKPRNRVNTTDRDNTEPPPRAPSMSSHLER